MRDAKCDAKCIPGSGVSAEGNTTKKKTGDEADQDATSEEDEFWHMPQQVRNKKRNSRKREWISAPCADRGWPAEDEDEDSAYTNTMEQMEKMQDQRRLRKFREEYDSKYPTSWLKTNGEPVHWRYRDAWEQEVRDAENRKKNNENANNDKDKHQPKSVSLLKKTKKVTSNINSKPEKEPRIYNVRNEFHWDNEHCWITPSTKSKKRSTVIKCSGDSISSWKEDPSCEESGAATEKWTPGTDSTDSQLGPAISPIPWKNERFC